MDEEKNTAFVIMAFDKEFDAIYSDLIKPSLEKIGYEVKRADSLLSQQNILKDIVREIAFSDIIVADLTSLNPNVFYELGIAHALRKPTILLTQSIEELPFDLRSYRVVSYSTRFDEIGDLCDNLIKIGEKAKSKTLEFSNPVIDFLPIPQDISSQTMADNSLIPREIEDVSQEEDEKGLWDFISDSESSMLEATKLMERIVELVQEVGEKIRKYTDQANQLQNSGVPGSASKMHKLVELSAFEILSFSDKVSEELPKFRDSWDTFSESVTEIIRKVKIKDPEDLEAGKQFQKQLMELSEALSEGLAGTKAFRNSQANLKGLSRSMNRAVRKVTSTLDKLIADLEQSISYCAKAISLVDEKLK